MGERRIVNTASDLVFYTNTDECDYPIFLTMEREVWLKARPHVRIAVKGEDAVKEVRRLPILAAFFVKSVVEVNDGVEHPFLPRALDVMKEVTKKEPEATKLEIAYEIYRGARARVGA
jgi:hypothetical protein